MPRPGELNAEARSWFDLLPEPIWVFDAQDLRILWANSAACAWLEYTPAALTSKTILDLRPAQDEAALRAALRDFENAARDGGKDTGRWRLVKKSGVETEAAIHWRSITLENHPAILAAVKDVSPLSRMERDNQALAADGAGHLSALDPSLAEHLIKIAGEKVRLGAWCFDLNPERVIWTDETAVIHDLPPGTSPTLEEGISYYLPEDRPRISASIRACAADGAAFDEVCQIKTAAGRRIWVRALGSARRNSARKPPTASGWKCWKISPTPS
jgi:PAS domain S-box-containing protein